MNRQQLLANAKRNIEEKRFRAEEQYESTMERLRKDPEFKSCERNFRLAQIEYADASEEQRLNVKEKIAKYKKEQRALLAKFRLDESALRPKYECKICNDSGYVNGSVCSCLQNELCRLLTAESNVMNTDYTFDNSAEKDADNLSVYKVARKACETGAKNILLTGNTGSGKTYLLTACSNYAISKGKSVLFVTAYTLNNMFLDAYLSDLQTGQAILDTLTDVDVLSIDDLGTEINRKNVTAEYLFAVLNERIAQRKQTFISTNLTLLDIRDRYDERIFSRLVDKNNTLVAKLEGSDKRIKQ
ncbi:MAG: ATP-binding protein [Firmicutes bacterium]|nr:ATP-binding protein [Bacillota bacterium]